MRTKHVAFLALILLLPWLSACTESGAMPVTMLGGGVTAARCADSSCTGFLICQNFEGTGYDNSESWSEYIPVDGVLDEDDTTTPMRGSQQLKNAGASSNYPIATSPSFTGSSTIGFHLRYRATDSTPASARYMVSLHDSGDAVVMHLDIRTNGEIRVYHGTGYATTTDTPVADGTMVHLWGYYVAGSGADGVYKLYKSANSTKPESKSIDGSNGTSTADVEVIKLWEYNNETGGAYFDQVLVSTAEIGTVCD